MSIVRNSGMNTTGRLMPLLAGLVLAHSSVVLADDAQRQKTSIVWPGAGAGQPNPQVGYPPVSFWKEEGVIGNNWINSQIDQNGTWFDIYYPGAGGTQGISTRNEGYSDGLDTFPALLSADRRGQMHLNQMMLGIRVDDMTHWMSNPNGVSYDQVQQSYVPDTQTIHTTSRLHAGSGGAFDIGVEQFDFSPKGSTLPPNGNKGLLIKRTILTNHTSVPVAATVYLYMDPALNGGDAYDAMFFDSSVGAMVAYDNVSRTASGTGCCFPGSDEYNPTTFAGYSKSVSVYLGAQLKVCSSVGSALGGTFSVSWRDLGSTDQGQGWIAVEVSLNPETPVEVDALIVGGYANTPNAGGDGGPYDVQMKPAFEWFGSQSAQALQNMTNAYWQNFLASGVGIQTPDSRINTLYRRGLLATMLHFDENKGGLIAGFRNGAYPYVWPRDMAWAAVTLSRTGHTDIVSQMTRYLRDITYRDFETWTPGNTPGFAAAGGSPFFGTRKGFWKQKYSTDGYVIWGAPQVDETAVFPWMVYYNYLVTGDVGYLSESEPGNPANTTYAAVKDAAIAMSQTSVNDGVRLNHRQSYPGSSTLMMYSNNIWEDQYDTLIFSNANIVRGLRDAAAIAGVLGQTGDAADFTNRGNGVLSGLNDKLDWNRENTDISLLAIVYPFATHSPTETRAVRIVDRINGVAADGNGQTKPLMRFPGQYLNDASDYVGLLDRYYGDGYWGNGALGPTPAGPWFLSTMWYGCYYAMRSDSTLGRSDIDNHYYRLNRTADHNGPLGFGAEQMAPSNSLLYSGQSDFSLQAAWPNAWESMSFYVDSVMQFLDYTPDAPGNTLRINPRLPTAWPTFSATNLRVGNKRISVAISDAAAVHTQVFTNIAGGALNAVTSVKLAPGRSPCSVRVNGVPRSYTIDASSNRVILNAFPLASAALASATLEVRSLVGPTPDWNHSGDIGVQDIFDFLAAWFTVAADFNGVNGTTVQDIFDFLAAWFTGCP